LLAEYSEMSSLSHTIPRSPLSGHLIILDVGTQLGQGRVLSYTPQNKNLAVLVSNISSWPDGVKVDTRPGKGQIYWTCMGLYPGRSQGVLMRGAADGSGAEVIVGNGETNTPKQLAIDMENERLYWSDREGMRVMRSSLDGSNIETLVRTGTTDEDMKDETRHCVGITIDLDRGLLYWTQKVSRMRSKLPCLLPSFDVVCRDLPMVSRAAYFVPTSMFLPGRPRTIDPISRHSSLVSPSQ
jgi:hypothetical protein